MELFTKLKKILFDEVTTEIPVITKEEKKTEEVSIKKSEPAEPKKRVHEEEKDDEVVIKKIETPKRDKRIELVDDDVYDMPKLKEEAKQEVKRSTFTFPVFGDDEDDGEVVAPKRRERKEERREPERKREKPKDVSEEPKTKPKESVGYTNAFDYSYGKYKGDYKTNREQAKEILTKTLSEKEEHRVFTPSPIISPVYGVLNENYKKEDIVAKKEDKNKTVEPLDLDSVRRKAYGTLEEEIESSLNRKFDVPSEPENSYNEDDDEGISIDDLLVDSEEELDNLEDTVTSLEKLDEDTELFDKLNVIDEEECIEEASNENDSKDEEDDEGDDDLLRFLKENESLDKKVPPIIDDSKEEVKPEAVEEKMEKTENKDEESAEEEDLFDLIESIYEGKGEE